MKSSTRRTHEQTHLAFISYALPSESTLTEILQKDGWEYSTGWSLNPGRERLAVKCSGQTDRDRLTITINLIKTAQLLDACFRC